MSKVTYEEFYFRPIDDNLDFEIVMNRSRIN